MSDYAVFILGYRRPERCYTYDALRKYGYTGRAIIVLDDGDTEAAAYRQKFPEVRTFNKQAVAEQTESGDNTNDLRSSVFARNACFDIAKELGIEWFILMDDDYYRFFHKQNGRGEYINSDDPIRNLDAVFAAMMAYYQSIPALSIAMTQSGDFMGGDQSDFWNKPRRKCMNSFFCSTHRPFKFVGRLNEDVNTYVALGARGGLFLSIPCVGLKQKQTQSNAGGLSDVYRDQGTYVKSFFSVMYQPSSVKVIMFPATRHARIHHKVKWRYTVPQIVSADQRKARH